MQGTASGSASQRAAAPAQAAGGGRSLLAQQVLSFLEDKIITRELAPGTRLVEEKLGADYGISRTPLREALRLLEASSLVVRRPGRSVLVAPMTLQNLNHVFACRVPLEGLAATTLALAPDERREPAVRELDIQLARMARTLAEGDTEAGFRANVELTQILHRDCGNPVLAGLLAQLDKPALRYRHWAYVRQPQMLPMAVDTNAAMITAIREGNAVAAGEVTRELVRRAWTLVRETFSDAPAGRKALHG